MKKHFIAFMMPFLTLATGFAQEAAQDVPVKQDTKEISYWTDPASGDKRLLNKSKFRDNWFVGLQAGAFYSWGTHTSSSGFFDQFRPAGALSIGKWIAPAGGQPEFPPNLLADTGCVPADALAYELPLD